MAMKDILNRMLNHEELTREETKNIILGITKSEFPEEQITALLTGLQMRGVTVDELLGFRDGILETGVPAILDCDRYIDVVGTGGDRKNTFNISTTAGFVISASGIKVAKHGNRSVSSKCGAADCLEALGTKLELDAKQNEKMLDEIGMCFMFAPKYHSSMKYASPVRRELGIRTVFNILGPLANPANANRQLMGVYQEELVEPLAKVLSNLGVKRGAVVYGYDGLDEITACNKTLVCEIKDKKLKTYTLDPRDYGMEYANSAELVGGDKNENAQNEKTIYISNIQFVIRNYFKHFRTSYNIFKVVFKPCMYTCCRQ